MTVRAIVLAAGAGTRMQSDLPKVLFDVCGRPIVSWVVDAVAGAAPDEIVVVVGHGADAVRDVLPDGVRTVLQEEQLGTGHAVMTAVESMEVADDDTVLVVPGDSPLFTTAGLRALLDGHAAAGSAATLLTTEMSDPTGYGRVVRAGDRVAAIVEEADADDEQRAIREVAVSTYAFTGGALRVALAGLTTDNAQGEYYLTDVVGILSVDGGVAAVAGADPDEVQNVNSHDQLAAVTAAMQRRINESLMRSGVWMQDPGRTYVAATASVAPGARLHTGVHLRGSTTVAAGAQVGPEVFAEDSEIGPGALVWYSVLRGASVGENVEVGPFASLRPGTRMEAGSKAGTFVETKATTIGPGAKVPHLAYMGDAEIGAGANIGAGSITCNYDGFEKHRTIIGERAFVGSDTMLVAPVEIGDGAYTGAGSVISRDVPPGSLAVERSQQREVPGYAAKRAARAENGDE